MSEGSSGSQWRATRVRRVGRHMSDVECEEVYIGGCCLWGGEWRWGVGGERGVCRLGECACL